jgi:two-component system, LytTR family, sensor kinase
VARLSDLLRLSLDPSKRQEVPLSEELAFLDGYLEIEQTRFSERLQVTKQIEAGTETALVPFLLLQPLVENAIRHGIEPREERGCLAITARRQEDRLELRVRDDGPGLANKNDKPQGIGLSNTRSRLQALYGDQFTFELRDLVEGGLEARISLPFRTHAKAS